MQRYFVDFNENDKYIEITGTDFHHIKNVMRMKTGDTFFVSNKDKAFFASIKEFTLQSVIVELQYEIMESHELNVNVIIAQGMPKGDKFESIIQKTTELGVGEIIPVLSERSLVKTDSKTEKKKLERYEKIAKEAAEQSHRNKVPLIHGFKSFKEFLVFSDNYDHKFVAYEGSLDMTLKDNLKCLKDGDSVLFFIGPEGGISPNEYKELVENKFISISLGKRILRTETAPLFIMSAIVYETEIGG